MKNYFYFIVGLLCILFAITHTWNGQSAALPMVNNTPLDNETKTIFTYLWHIVGVENLIFGITLIVMSFYKSRANVRFTAWVIIVVMLMRWLVITLTTLLNKDGTLNQLLPDTIAIVAVVILLVLGTRVPNENSNKK